MRTALLIIALFVVSGCEGIGNREVSMVCEWVLYGKQSESFIFSFSQKEVYWVNEDKRYPIKEINKGRIVFEGVRSSLRIGEKTSLKNVSLTFTINRVSGELYIEGISIPRGYSNVCIEKDKVF